MILVGFTHTDTLENVQKMAKKIAGLRVFSDEAGKMKKKMPSIYKALFDDPDINDTNHNIWYADSLIEALLEDYNVSLMNCEKAMVAGFRDILVGGVI